MDIVLGQRWRWPEDPVVEGVIVEDDISGRKVTIQLDSGRRIEVDYDRLLDHWVLLNG